MKDFYQALGVNKEASAHEIKSAYKKLALNAHPDRGGSDELMGLIIEAYKTLSDPASKHDFDERWNIFQQTQDDADVAGPVDGHLEAGPTPAFSVSFREEHASLITLYEQTPLIPSEGENFKPFKANAYQINTGDEVLGFDTIFDYVNELKARASGSVAKLSPPKTALTPLEAIKYLTEFLSGSYYGTCLESVSAYLSAEIEKCKRVPHSESELQLFEGIFEIISIADTMPEDKSALILSLKKITDYAKHCDNERLISFISLFYNKNFRNLFTYALHLHWQSNTKLFEKETLEQFDGQQEARELLNVLKERLSRSESSEGLISTVRYVKFLSNLEKDMHPTSGLEQTAKDFRERAFHLLDWFVSVNRSSSRQIVVNNFLQIGINFQQAARLEDSAHIKMADEKLALKMYLIAVGVANHSTPDVEMYINTQVLKYSSAFQFKDEKLGDIITALQERLIILSDVFPFFTETQSNIAFLKHGDKTLHLMRQLLHSMIEANEHSKLHSLPSTLDHTEVTVLYQAYEACLKNWYQEKYDPVLENRFRRNLMKALLAEHQWTFADIEKNLTSPWVMVERDEEGWMDPSQSVPSSQHSSFEVFQSISGAELNNTTGHIVFFLKPWREGMPHHQKGFTLYDVQEMLEKNLEGAFFSLDPVDPNKPYHPFNLMRYAPSQLHESEFLNTMLLTDYILKFLTTRQEVQGKYPFDQRRVDQMISHLPEYLKKIIDDFHAQQHTGAMHRFWIEAEETDVLISDEPGQEDITRIGLTDVRMVVKKHRLKKDVHGDLKDDDSESEGWPLYVLDAAKVSELEQGLIKIQGHAMVFVNGENRVLVWENNKFLLNHVPVDLEESLIRLYQQPKEADARIRLNSKNMPLLYRVTKTIAQQAGLSHRYSPEFIFAYELTRHYDEFAQHIPEFGRLKQLSKICSLMRVLNSIRKANNEKLQVIRYLTSGGTTPKPDPEIYKEYIDAYNRIRQRIILEHVEWQPGKSDGTLLKKWREDYALIEKELGPIVVPENADEVHAIAKKFYIETVKRDSEHGHGFVSFNGFLANIFYPIYHRMDNNSKKVRTKIAQELSDHKECAYKVRLAQILSPVFASSLQSYSYAELYGVFTSCDIDSLARMIERAERAKIHKAVNIQLTGTDNNAIRIDLGGTSEIKYSANYELRDRLMEKQALRERLESGFAQIGLGAQQAPVDLTGKCRWVPASIRHETAENNASRSLFFVYGGVNIQPRLNVLYQKVGPNGEHLKFGVTKNPARRYTAEQLGGGKIRIVARGNRKEMLQLERNVHETLPIGPEERQTFYVKKQVEKGYKAPPYT